MNKFMLAAVGLMMVVSLTGCKTTAAYSQFCVGLEDMRAGNVDEALSNYNQAITTDPREYLYFEHRAYAYELKEMFREAVTDLEEAIRLAPKDNPSRKAYFHLRIAVILHHDLSDYEGALEHYETAMSIYENDRTVIALDRFRQLEILHTQLNIKRLHRDMAAQKK